jgi:DNA-directed RNA polymerase subunit M/transcription elongation factor TFIIS
MIDKNSIRNDIINKFKFVIPIDLYKNKSYNKLRRCIVLLIAELLYKHELIYTIDYKKRSNIIIKIELSCYNQTINKSNKLMYIKSWDNPKFEYLYRVYTNKVTKNLDIDSEVNSDYLISKVINNTINPNIIANLNSNILCPSKSIDIINNLNLRNNQKINFKTSEMYQCRNCKKKSVRIEMVQIKRIDEPQTMSLTCTFCSNNWLA